MNTFILKSSVKKGLLCPFFLFLIFSFSCAAARKDAQVPVEQYRVALINAGVYTSLYNQAVVELESYREIRLVAGDRLTGYLSRYELTPSSLAQAKSFSQLSRVEGIDFALVLIPAPAAYPAGYVGFKSINWRRKTIHTVPAVKPPGMPREWLLRAGNGWVSITTNPPGALLEVNGQARGSAPVFLMAEKDEINVRAQWTKKVNVSENVRIGENAHVIIFAPQEYLAKLNKKGFYQRLQDADERHGEKFYIGFYVLVTIGGIVMLFINPVPY